MNQGICAPASSTDDEWPRLTEAIERCARSRCIDETPALRPRELRANARRLARQCGKLGLIVVDYLQLMSGSGASGSTTAPPSWARSRGPEDAGQGAGRSAR